ncbi:MAG: hypothetical protein ACRYGI_09905 [Janthinobacterium lividum]
MKGSLPYRHITFGSLHLVELCDCGPAIAAASASTLLVCNGGRVEQKARTLLAGLIWNPDSLQDGPYRDAQCPCCSS